MKKSKPHDLAAIFNRITNICEINNAIHSAVSIARTGQLTVQNYLDAIESLLKMGCDIDQGDERGRFHTLLFRQWLLYKKRM